MIDRVVVLQKYNFHCAYCGRIIDLKSMQVDHKLSKRLGGTSDIENLMPSCRMCNHYKRAGDPEYLRRLLLEMYKKLSTIYIFRVAEIFGMVTWNTWDGVFYYEKPAVTK
jgi:hypothetical protein